MNLLEGTNERNPSTQASTYLFFSDDVLCICLILVGCGAETAGNHLEEGSEEFGALGIGA